MAMSAKVDPSIFLESIDGPKLPKITAPKTEVDVTVNEQD